MPTEDRRIIFNNEEIYKALYAMCSQKQIKKPPPGTVTSLKIDDSDNTNLIVTIENPHDPENAVLVREYSRDFLAAALMLLCRGLGIPLPKGATKSVLIKDNQVMLRVQIG